MIVLRKNEEKFKEEMGRKNEGSFQKIYDSMNKLFSLFNELKTT